MVQRVGSSENLKKPPLVAVVFLFHRHKDYASQPPESTPPHPHPHSKQNRYTHEHPHRIFTIQILIKSKNDVYTNSETKTVNHRQNLVSYVLNGQLFVYTMVSPNISLKGTPQWVTLFLADR